MSRNLHISYKLISFFKSWKRNSNLYLFSNHGKETPPYTIESCKANKELDNEFEIEGVLIMCSRIQITHDLFNGREAIARLLLPLL